MTTTTPAQPTPDETLAFEAQGRTRAAIGAWAAAFLSLAGSILIGIGQSRTPSENDSVVSVVDALGNLSRGEAIPPGRLAAQTEWLGDHAEPLIAGALALTIGSLLIFLPLSYLYRATKARNPGLTRAVIVLGAIGCVCYAVGTGVSLITYAAGAADFAGGDNSEARDAISPPAYLIGLGLKQLLGSFALGFSVVMLGMNAMRVGLLTRFMGVLGVIVGATFVLPLDQQGIIRSFWLVALGFLIFGRWPNGVPAAWETGRAQPWPSAAQARMRRGDAPLPETPAPVPPPSDGLSPGQRRKKRKKR